MPRAKRPTSVAPTVSPSPSRRLHLLALLGLVVVTVLAYSNSFDGVFVLDDHRSIVANPTIRQLWPLRDVLAPPAPSTVNGRPVVNLTFAVNGTLHGTAIWGYHAVNLAIHLAAGLTLFALVRRTLLLPKLRERFEAIATPSAFFIATLWLLHPLQTESVTYVVQRVESLMGLFYLLTLYCFVRGTGSPSPHRWYAGAIAACSLGMGSKEVMVSAPLIVLLYDRTFLTGAFRDALRQRRGLYLGLGATWLLLGLLVIGAQGRGGSAGFGTPIAWWQYALTQCWAIVHYLRLTFWPSPLVLDYGSELITAPARFIPGAILVTGLMAATVVGVVRRHAWGFLGAWFFALLAPSSSIVPVATQTIAEHRMYLPLAAIVVAVVLLAFVRFPRHAWVPLGMVGVILATLTYRRNEDYSSALTLWQKTVDARPGNARAHDNLASAWEAAGRLDAALLHFRRAVKLAPQDPGLLYNLGSALLAAGQSAEAQRVLAESLRLDPNHAQTHNNLAIALIATGQLDEAVNHYAQAVLLRPDEAEFRYNYGTALLQLSRAIDAVAQFQAALRLKPDYALAHHDLGAALAQLRRFDEAVSAFQSAARLDPADARAPHNLGNLFGMMGRMDEARRAFEAALVAKSDFTPARMSLADLLLETGRAEEAISLYETVVRTELRHVTAHQHLGIALLRTGRVADALTPLREAVRLQPNEAKAHFWLGNALAHSGETARAIVAYETALRLDPNHPGARENLARVRSAGK